ncbi:MAG: sulfoquinovosidase [Thermotogota bacterium]|nr:sulfoquinovosidase [Thermotogota bacterium]
MNHSVSIELKKEGEKLLLQMKDTTIFDGKVFQAKGIPRIRDIHGHLKISEKVWEKVAIGPEKISLASKEPLSLKIEGEERFNRLIIELGAFPDEIIFGGGEQYTHINLKGRRLPILVQEQGVGRGWNLVSFVTAVKGTRGNWYSTYFPQPVFFSSRGYGVIVDTTATVIADFRKTRRTILEVWDNHCKLIFLNGSLEDMVSRFHQIYGSKVNVQDWVFGVWIASQGGVKEADRTILTAKKWDIPLTALWCQDWSGKKVTSFGRQVYWNWSYDRKDYNDLPLHIQRWRKEGVHFLGYINPFLIKDGPLYKEAERKGFLVKKASGETYDVIVTTFPAGMIDFSNPEAFSWYKDAVIKKNMIDIGMSGWMADYGEYLPLDARLYGGDGLKYHNRYVVDWARLNFEAVEESKCDAVFFMRAGFLGSTRFSPVYWAGDQNVDWSKSDGLPSVIPAMLSMGMSGVKLSHFDTGGFTSLLWMKRTPELFMRWAELAAFSPIMRTHQTNRPGVNVQFDSDQEILRHFSKMGRLHYALKEYLKEQLRASNNMNLPLVRHLAIHYPEDLEAWKIKYQYLLGRDLLVAPVLKPRVREWKVYLPDDVWIHVWSGQTFKSGWVIVDAPLSKPPVFVRENSKFAGRICETCQALM